MPVNNTVHKQNLKKLKQKQSKGALNTGINNAACCLPSTDKQLVRGDIIRGNY